MCTTGPEEILGGDIVISATPLLSKMRNGATLCRNNAFKTPHHGESCSKQ